MRHLAMLCLTSLAACSHIDTGKVDYRRADAPSDYAKSISTYVEALDQCKAEAKPADGRQAQCPPLLKGHLFRKNTALGEPIIRNDVYSIRLEHGFIGYLTEAPFSLGRLAQGRSPTVKRGEVVVLAHTFEFPESVPPGTVAPKSEGSAVAAATRFQDLSNLNGVKVIYYSPDVEQGQDLNFSNIPLQAPTTYQGNPVGIQLIVMELDRVSGPMRSLLKQLAEFGKSTNVVPGGAVGSLLLDLGTSLLSQANDDIVFDYRFVLDPADGVLTPYESAGFEAGRYVLRREHHRKNDTIWRNIALDHNTGKLMWNYNGSSPETFTADTYFTVNIIKHPKGTKPSVYDFRTLDNLNKEIEAAADQRDQALDVLTSRLQERALSLRSSNWSRDLAQSWEEVTQRHRQWGRAAPILSDGESCSVLPHHRFRAAEAELVAAQSAMSFVRLLRLAAADQVSKAGADQQEDVWKSGERQWLLDEIATFFVPLESSGSLTMKDLTAFDAFWAKFFADGVPANSFQEELAAATRRRWSLKGCAEARQFGLVAD